MPKFPQPQLPGGHADAKDLVTMFLGGFIVGAEREPDPRFERPTGRAERYAYDRGTEVGTLIPDTDADIAEAVEYAETVMLAFRNRPT